MILSLIGLIDLHAFIGIDDTPFNRSAIFSKEAIRLHNDLDAYAEPAGNQFISKFQEAFGCRWKDIKLHRAKPIFSHQNLFGDGVELVLPGDATFVRYVREVALGFASDHHWGIYPYVLLEDEPYTPLRKEKFVPEILMDILVEMRLSVRFLVKPPGCIVLQIDVESDDPRFVHYWYPVFHAIETGTYHEDSYEDLFEFVDDETDEERAEERRKTAFSAAYKKLVHVGAANRSLVQFRRELTRHLPASVPRIMSKSHSDEIDTGFYCLLRCSTTDNWAEALKTVAAHNEYVSAEPIRSDPYRTYLGWTAACVVTDTSEGGDDERVVANTIVALTTYNLFYFYETYLQTLLSEHVYSHSARLSRFELTRQRRFGEALHFLGDLRRVSQYGSDRHFFERWIDIAGLEKLRAKTSAGLVQILDSLEERHRSRTATIAKWLGFSTAVIGFSSIMSWVTSFQTYFGNTMVRTTPDGTAMAPSIKPDMLPSGLVHYLFGTPEGRQVLVIYAIVGAIFVLGALLGSLIWLLGKGVEGFFRDEIPRACREIALFGSVAVSRIRRLGSRAARRLVMARARR